MKTAVKLAETFREVSLLYMWASDVVLFIGIELIYVN